MKIIFILSSKGFLKVSFKLGFKFFLPQIKKIEDIYFFHAKYTV